MRAEIIHITDHAVLRWNERVSCNIENNVHDIIKIVKLSKIIKKNEPLPYSLPRIDGTVYAVYKEILLVLEPITIDEYKLITVIAEKRLDLSKFND
jgi:hypothetical protein